jgi:formamidopyrimidine-DNA glycosylase
MPELAEVEFNRKQWDAGLGHPVLAAHCADGKRVFRGVQAAGLRRALTGASLVSSEARGKRMIFSFSSGAWLGLHLGMTGRLRCEPAGFTPGQHDHLVLRQAGRCLVFHDPRQFGRIRFHAGQEMPAWWASLPPEVLSPQFTPAAVWSAFQRHGRLPAKAALLLQEHFPGIGNWMADEILWRAGIHPRSRCGALTAAQTRRLWREVRAVSRQAMATVGKDYSDPPKRWLFHQRWGRGGCCPKHRLPLRRATVGGRTTAWCTRCQPG